MIGGNCRERRVLITWVPAFQVESTKACLGCLVYTLASQILIIFGTIDNN